MSVSTICSLGQTVPQTWKHGMKLESQYGGGMSQYSYKLQINDSISYLDVISEKGAKHLQRKFTQQELNDILIFLAKNNFDKIKSEDTGPTYDKGSESIILTWDHEVIGASESSSVRVIDEYRDDFNIIQEYLMNSFEKKKKI